MASKRLLTVRTPVTMSEDTKGRFDVEFVINGKKGINAADLFTLLKSLFDFPEYFGGNWDALNDCMHDLKVKESVESFAITITNAEYLLQNDDNALVIFVDILVSCINNWWEKNKKFRFYFTCKAETFEAFKSRLINTFPVKEIYE